VLVVVVSRVSRVSRRVGGVIPPLLTGVAISATDMGVRVTPGGSRYSNSRGTRSALRNARVERTRSVLTPASNNVSETTGHLPPGWTNLQWVRHHTVAMEISTREREAHAP